MVLLQAHATMDTGALGCLISPKPLTDGARTSGGPRNAHWMVQALKLITPEIATTARKFGYCEIEVVQHSSRGPSSPLSQLQRSHNFIQPHQHLPASTQPLFWSCPALSTAKLAIVSLLEARSRAFKNRSAPCPPLRPRDSSHALRSLFKDLSPRSMGIATQAPSPPRTDPAQHWMGDTAPNPSHWTL